MDEAPLPGLSVIVGKDFPWLAGAVAAGALLSWLAIRPVAPRMAAPVLDLVAELPRAIEARPSAESFRTVDAGLGAATRRSILVAGPSRLVFRVQVPDHAALRVGLGLVEEAWTTEGDGVLFRIAIGPPDGDDQVEALFLVIDPFSVPEDRGWHDVEVDLSAYAGLTIDLFLNTSPSRPGHDDRRGDLALWGAPHLVAPEP